jgi:ammonium transporter, Amt family
MSSVMRRNALSLGLVTAALATTLVPAFAATAPVPNKGDTAWMLTSSALVLLMTIPGLALFYGGLVRSKNMLSVLMHVFYSVCIVSVLWVLFGYSMVFTSGSAVTGDFFGGMTKAFLRGITPDSTVETFTHKVVIPEYAYIAFQMTFAAITPALIVGAFAERMKFSAVALFIPLWTIVVYFPIAHMVWYWGGPDAIIAAAKAVADAGTDATKKAAAEAALALAKNDGGYLFKLGAIDFAGGTVVHINAGIAGLVAAILVGRRVGFSKEVMAPHSLTMTMIGASLLWVGWFGFNAGSALEANGTAALAMINTFVATAAAALSWLLFELMFKGKPSLLGAVTGAVAGLVAVTPASGFAGPAGSLALGLVVSPICYLFCAGIKNTLKYDDALDVFGVHCIGGIVGSILTAVLAAPQFGGQGIFDYELNKIGDYDMIAQIIIQSKAVGITLAWSAIGTAVILLILKLVPGLRRDENQEREGLDLSDHGERAYNT